MEPGTGFWEGVGAGVADSPGWMVVGSLLVVGVLFIVAKYIVPSVERTKSRELDIRERETQNDSDRIKANAALAENMRGLRESNDTLAQQNAALVAAIEESKARSREMGGKVDRIDSTTQHTDTLVEDIHNHLIGREGTD